MNTKILYDNVNRMFSSDGKTVFSTLLFIPVGKTALLSLYNMYNELYLETNNDGEKNLVDKSCIVVHKLSIGDTQNITKKDLECNESFNILSEMRRLLEDRRVFHEPVYQNGKAWVINPCNNFALISTPGFYMLELHDPNQFDVAHIDYTLLSVSDSLAIPNEFKLGG